MSDMKLIIGETEYDAGEALAKVSLSTLYELKVRTGYGAKSLAEGAKRIGKMVGEDPMQILEDKEAFQVFRIIVWLARRHAGERMSLDEATDFPLDQMFLGGKDDREQMAAAQEAFADPKATADSAADVSAEPVGAPTTT